MSLFPGVHNRMEPASLSFSWELYVSSADLWDATSKRSTPCPRTDVNLSKKLGYCSFAPLNSKFRPMVCTFFYQPTT